MIFSFLCNDLYIVVCPFVLFLLAIVLSVRLRFRLLIAPLVSSNCFITSSISSTYITLRIRSVDASFLFTQRTRSRKIPMHVQYENKCIISHNRIGGVMVSVLASSVVDIGFEPLSGPTKNYKIGICCYLSTRGLLFQ